MKKIDLSILLTYLLLLLCFCLAFLAIKFEMTPLDVLPMKEKLFTLCAGIFMLFFGFLLALTTQIKWKDHSEKQLK